MTATLTEGQETVAFDAQLWKKAVNLISSLAYEICPALWHARLAAGTALAFTREHFMIDTQGQWRVAAGKGGWYTVNGTCTCKDFTEGQAPEGFCKHKIAAGVFARASALTPEMLSISPEEFLAWYAEGKGGDLSGYADLFTLGTPAPRPSQAEPPAGLPHVDRAPDGQQSDAEDVIPLALDRRFITYIQNKPFVQYAGLLALAHEQGLMSLDACIQFHSAEVVYASATATFADGRHFTEWADASQTNVKFPLHFPRFALTRAKARALRDALNIGLLCLEELGQ